MEAQFEDEPYLTQRPRIKSPAKTERIARLFRIASPALIIDESLLSVTGARTDQAEGKGLIGCYVFANLRIQF